MQMTLNYVSTGFIYLARQVYISRLNRCPSLTFYAVLALGDSTPDWGFLVGEQLAAT